MVLLQFYRNLKAWERGLNENTNGLLRQYFPKKMDFRTIDDKNIVHAMERLNNRPRKTLGYATPNELFYININNMDNLALVS
jgi:IS30 family transposase